MKKRDPNLLRIGDQIYVAFLGQTELCHRGMVVDRGQHGVKVDGSRCFHDDLGRQHRMCDQGKTFWPSWKPHPGSPAALEEERRRERKKNPMPILNLKLTEEDLKTLEGCPCCGGRRIELTNSHTAYYTLSCLDCEDEGLCVEVSGKAFGTNKASHELSRQDHEQAKASAIAAWNRRPETIRVAPAKSD